VRSAIEKITYTITTSNLSKAHETRESL